MCSRRGEPQDKYSGADDTQPGNPNKTPKKGPIWYNTSQRKVAIRSKLSPISDNNRLDDPNRLRDVRSSCDICEVVAIFAK